MPRFAIGTNLELDSSFPNSGLPISFLRFTYLINVHAYLSTWLYMCYVCAVPTEATRGLQILWKWSYRSYRVGHPTWVLETEPGSSTRSVSINQWAFSPAYPVFFYLNSSWKIIPECACPDLFLPLFPRVPNVVKQPSTWFHYIRYYT